LKNNAIRDMFAIESRRWADKKMRMRMWKWIEKMWMNVVSIGSVARSRGVKVKDVKFTGRYSKEGWIAQAGGPPGRGWGSEWSPGVLSTHSDKTLRHPYGYVKADATRRQGQRRPAVSVRTCTFQQTITASIEEGGAIPRL
jgi:hypothetical protein